MNTHIANIIELFLWFNADVFLKTTDFIASTTFAPLRIATNFLNFDHINTLATKYINHVLDTFVIPAAQIALIPYHVAAALFSLFHIMILQPLQTSFAPKAASHDNGTRVAAVKQVTSLSPQLNTFRCWQGKEGANPAPMTAFQSRRPQLRIDTQAAESALGMRRRITPLRIEPTPAPVLLPSSTSPRTDEGYETVSNHSGDGNIEAIALSFEPFNYEAAAQAEKKKRSVRHRRLHPSKKLFTGRLPVGINAEQRDHLLSKAVVATC